jgi:hypothetical protein
MDTAISHTTPLATPFAAPAELAALLGHANAPLVLDVRREAKFTESPRMVCGAVRCTPEEVEAFARGHSPRDIAAWRAQPLPTFNKRPDWGVTGEQASRWITRARPKIDRIACPWLIRRFIDPRAVFFYAPTDQVFAEAQRLNAVPYDIPGAPVSHTGPQGEQCSFDALLAGFDLHLPALDALARIVRGADTDQLALAPASAGLLAVSLGMSALHTDDHAMLEAMMPVYDALYAWCQQSVAGQAESHSWRP